MQKRHKQIESLHGSHVLEAQAIAKEMKEEERRSAMDDVLQAQREAMRETQNETPLRGQWED